MNDYLIIAARVATIMPLLFIVTLLMGKRLVGELQVFDFLLVIVLGSLVGENFADPATHHGPVATAILLLAGAQWLLSRLNLQFRLVERLTTFEPTIVIRNGRILPEKLKQIRYSLTSLLEMLREKGVFRLSEVEFAIIEANGKLSVLKKSQYSPMTPADTGTPTGYYGLSHSIIAEGKVDREKLRELQLDEKWLLEELKKQNFDSPQQIFYAQLDTEGNLYLSPY